MMKLQQAPPAPAGLMIVVGSGDQRYREYLLAGASRGRALWLFDSVAPTWQRTYIVGFTIVDVSDERALVAVARALRLKKAIAGVFCYDEALILPASHIVEALDLPGMRPETVRRCRDKRVTRATLEAAGISQPRSVAVSCLQQARKQAAAIGYPIVLKPRGLGASQGVVLVANASELEAGYEAASSANYPGVPTFDDGVLVEEYVVGPEISVDAVIVEGDYRPMFIAHKRLGPKPFFEESGHIIDPQDPLLRSEELFMFLRLAHSALGIWQGTTHTEIRLTSAGPRLIEVNARLGGDLIPYLGMLATGIDPGRVAARVAVGEPVMKDDLTARRPTVVGIRFSYPAEDCRVRAVRVPDASGIPGLHSVMPMVEDGTILRLPPRGYLSRYAYTIAHANDVTACNTVLDLASALIDLNSESAPDYDRNRLYASWLPAAAQVAHAESLNPGATA